MRALTLLGVLCANLVGFSYALFIISLHMERPGNDVLRLDKAVFIADAGEKPPDPGARGMAMTLPDDWRTRDMEGSTGWYRVTVPLATPNTEPWALYIPALEMVPAVHVNGVLLGGEADGASWVQHWQRPLMVTLSPGVLRAGDNQVDVRLHAYTDFGRITEWYLGPAKHILPHYAKRYFLRVTFALATATVGLCLSLYTAAIFFVRRSGEYGAFSALALVLSIQSLYVLTRNIPVPPQLWDYLVYAMFSGLVVTATMFTNRFFGLRQPRAEKFMLAVYTACAVALFPLVWINRDLMNLLGSNVWLSLVMICSIYPVLVLMLHSWKNFGLEAFCLVCVFSAMLCLAVHDWALGSGIGYRHNGLLLQFAAAIALLTFGIILLRRFLAAGREMEILNNELEQRVAIKTREIEESFSQTQQLLADKILSQERERIMREVHDGVGGHLIGALARLDTTNERDRALSEELGAALRDLRLTIDSLESVDGDLATVLGLLRNRVQDQLDDAGIKLDWRVGDLPPVRDLGPENALHVLRIVQEAITNARRHSGCQTILVATHQEDLIAGEACLSIEVSDDGHGFPPELRPGRGLKNMAYRAAQAGILLQRESSPGARIKIGFKKSQIRPNGL